MLGDASRLPPLALVQAAREGEGLSVAGLMNGFCGEWFCSMSLPGRTVVGRGVHRNGLSGHGLVDVRGMGKV